jgi:hypothetical protein
VKQHNEKLEALEELDKDPTVWLDTRCRSGAKSFKGICVMKEAPVTVALHNNISQGLSKLRDRLLEQRGRK